MAVGAIRHPAIPALAVAGFIGVAVPAAARPVWASGTFVYADLCAAAESGERTGRRITLRRSPNGDGLLYEAAASPAPLRADTVSLDADTKTIAFTVETESVAIAFRGTATVDALTGIIEDEAGAHPVRLPRVLRSHAHEICHGDGGDTTGSIGTAR